MNDDKEWIVEPREKWEPQIGPSEDVYSTMKKNGAELISKRIGLDGELIKMPPSFSDEEETILLDPPTHCSDNGEEFSKKGSASQQIMKVAGILSSLLREMIAVGSTESWVNSEYRPNQRFVAIEGEHLREVAERLVPLGDRKVVYRILKDEVFTKKERDRIVGDILLHFAFSRGS